MLMSVYGVMCRIFNKQIDIMTNLLYTILSRLGLTWNIEHMCLPVLHYFWSDVTTYNHHAYKL